ncbi:glycine rich domain-containing protein, partial [Segatella albensis]|uniref:glycine rich domain-containing protein n=1 Tax=Segatella albensis TaxID=77768 RepID=UPI0004696546
EFTAPLNTNYKIECWGASGGNAVVGYGGGGGYVSGEISLTKDLVLYVYIGQRGNNRDNYSSTYMFNGGGYANKIGECCGACGGGATDIRTTNGNWDNSTSLDTRIMIAGGGGGGGVFVYYSIFSSCAGGLEGYDGINNKDNSIYQQHQGKGGTQTAGGAAPLQWLMPKMEQLEH